MVADGALSLVRIVENNGDGSLCHARLALLVDEFLEGGGADLAEIGDAEHEADGVKDVGFPAPVQAGDGIEEWIKLVHNGPLGVGLEPIDDDALRGRAA